MSEHRESRRVALRRAALGAGTLAAAGLLRTGSAAAQSTTDDDLRDYLVEAAGLEQIAVLAYSTSVNTGAIGGRLKTTFQDFRDQEQAHANAWRSALDSLGFDAPDPPDSPTDTGVFDNVEGLSADAASSLTDLLGKLAGLKTGKQFLTYIETLERRELSYYLENAPGLDSEDLATTSAEVAGCQAQHLIVIGEGRGDSPAAALTAVTKAASPPGTAGGP